MSECCLAVTICHWRDCDQSTFVRDLSLIGLVVGSVFLYERGMRGFTILAFILVNAQSLCCAQEARSTQSGDQPVQLTVKNESDLPLKIQWIDFEGKPQDYGIIPAGQAKPFESYPGHNWQFVVNRQTVGSYRATNADRQTFTLSGGSSVPAPSQSETGDKGNGLFQQFRRLKEEGMERKNSGSSLPLRQGTPGGTAVAPASGSQVVAGAGTGSAMNPTEVKQLIDYHNHVRAEVGVGNVSWSPELASYAQEWADHLAKKGKFEHRPPSDKKYGENLAAGSHPGYNAVSGARGWYGEKPLYQAGAPFSMKFMDAGHYTQMVWRSSTQIGAGKAICKQGKYKGWTIVVCNYNPGGNMLGQPPY